MFYQEVVQAVFIFGAETWIFPAAISRKLEGVHMGFLRQVTGQKDNRQRDGNQRSAAEVRVIKEAGNKILGTYIDKRKATVAEWVTLRPIIEGYKRETGYEGGGR